MNKKTTIRDGVLIQKYRAGEVALLAVLVKRYHKVFCEKAYWITKDKQSAKDVAQESWIAIIDKLHTLQDVDRFRSWALRIVYTKAVDAIKLEKKADAYAKFAKPHDGMAKLEEEKKEQRRTALLEAIRQLPKDKQDIIRLFYGEGQSVEQISSFLNIPMGTVKSRLFNAREKLKSILKKVSHER